MKRKLLIVTPVFPRWEGDMFSPRFILDLARGLSQFYHVYVMCPYYFCAAEKEHLQDIEVIRFKYFYPVKWQSLSTGKEILTGEKYGLLAKLQFPFYFVSELLAIRNIIKSYEIDLINTHWLFPEGLIYSLVKKFVKKPHVMTVYGTDVFTLSRQGFLGKVIARYIIKHTDILLPVSTYVRYTLEKLAKKKFEHTIIPAGIEISKFRYTTDKGHIRHSLGIDKNYKIFLFFGYLVPKQGLDIVVEAARILKYTHEDFVLLIIGDGPLMPEYKKIVARYNLSENVKFLGWVDREQLPAYYVMSNAVLVPSRVDQTHETGGCSTVIQEALACGVPVIASRVNGITDIIKEGYNGWTFESDNYSELHKKMELIYTFLNTHPIKNNTQASAELFDSKTIAQQYHDQMKKLFKVQ